MSLERAALCITLASVLAGAAQAGETRSTAASTLLELSAAARAARIEGRTAEWLDLARATLRLAPEHPDLHISAARAAAAAGSREEALRHLSDAVRRGAGFDVGELNELAGLRNDSSFEPLFAAARANLSPLAHAKVFATIDDPELRPEGITWDPATSRLFIGSTRGEIWQIDANGRAMPFVRGQGLREVYGLKVDEQRRLLWVATSVFPDLLRPDAPAKHDVGVTGLLAFDLATGKKRADHWLDDRPTVHAFNDLAIMRSGDVLVTDSPTGTVYLLRARKRQFSVLAKGRDMTFPNGIVLSRDESHFFVAHVEGISRVDLRTGARERLRVPDTVCLNSIDGLAGVGRSLIGIQPSPYLSRVIRVELGDEGRLVERAVVLSSRTPAELAQTTATVAGKFLYVVAGSAAVNLQTSTSDAEDPVRPVILRIDLDQTS